jgi:hypothetical protein
MIMIPPCIRLPEQGVEKQASGRQAPVKWPVDFTGQARRAAFWKAQHNYNI